MNGMIDVFDYLRRMVSAVLLCPVAVAFWGLFVMSGFSLTNLLTLCGNIGQSLIAMSPEAYGVFLFQFLGGWASLAFLFLLMTFAFNPPKFNYDLKRKGEHHGVSVSH